MAWRGDPWLRTPPSIVSPPRAACTSTYCDPLCVPAGAACWRPDTPATGVFTNDQCLPSDRITFVHELGNAGYRTVLCGRIPQRPRLTIERLVGDIEIPTGAVARPVPEPVPSAVTALGQGAGGGRARSHGLR